ncbi:MAG UNVERIFIED_CONTAM: hypothetical protein LVT10_17810 [Anaerolineae bacterium]
MVHITFCSYEWLDCVTYDAHVIVVAGDGSFLSKPTSDDLLNAVQRALSSYLSESLTRCRISFRCLASKTSHPRPQNASFPP